MEEEKICARCNRKEDPNHNAITGFKPDGVKKSVPLCGECIKEVSPPFADAAQQLSAASEWVIHNYQEKA